NTPGAGDESCWVLDGHLEAGTARVLIDEERMLPGLAAVFGAKNTAVFLRTRGTAQRTHEHDVFIGWIHDDRADAAGLSKTHVRPRFARIGGLVDAVAHHV